MRLISVGSVGAGVGSLCVATCGGASGCIAACTRSTCNDESVTGTQKQETHVFSALSRDHVGSVCHRRTHRRQFAIELGDARVKLVVKQHLHARTYT
jgi:hypothetical protein